MEEVIIDNKEYIIICEIPNYVLLANKNNNNDILIQKIEKDNNQEFFCNIDSEKEFDKVFEQFMNKIKKSLS